MKRPARTAQPLGAILGKTINEAFARQGFASRELIVRWGEIAGREIAEHSQPLAIRWPREVEGQPTAAATLVLRVEGPMAIEIQHSSTAILDRVNRFLGWKAVGRLALRQAPLARPRLRVAVPAPDPAEVARQESALTDIADDGLRNALARLGAAVKQN
jgi:hypothetical protein